MNSGPPKKTSSHWFKSFIPADQDPDFIGIAWKLSLPWKASWLESHIEEAVICASEIAPVLIPRASWQSKLSLSIVSSYCHWLKAGKLIWIKLISSLFFFPRNVWNLTLNGSYPDNGTIFDFSGHFSSKFRASCSRLWNSRVLVEWQLPLYKFQLLVRVTRLTHLMV